MDSVNDKLFVLQYGRLGSDQSQNDLFLPGYLGQRCETAGSLIIKLQEIGIHILFAEQDIRYGIIGTLACVGGMEITAAYMMIISFGALAITLLLISLWAFWNSTIPSLVVPYRV